jgi:hypothetical protein
MHPHTPNAGLIAVVPDLLGGPGLVMTHHAVYASGNRLQVRVTTV